MSLIATVLTGILVAAVSSWITVNLALRRYHSERWWDRQVDAYTAVLVALHNSKAFSERHLQALQEGYEVQEEFDKELRKRGQLATEEIFKAIDLGAFLLSEVALQRLRKFREDEAAAADEDGWLEHLEADFRATNNCLVDMIVIAKKDLVPRRRLFIA